MSKTTVQYIADPNKPLPPEKVIADCISELLDLPKSQMVVTTDDRTGDSWKFFWEKGQIFILYCPAKPVTAPVVVCSN